MRGQVPSEGDNLRIVAGFQTIKQGSGGFPLLRADVNFCEMDLIPLITRTQTDCRGFDCMAVVGLPPALRASASRS